MYMYMHVYIYSIVYTVLCYCVQVMVESTKSVSSTKAAGAVAGLDQQEKKSLASGVRDTNQ